MKRGFTLVELLIVISVITILTAISIAVYDAQEKSAAAAQAEAMVSIVAAAAEKYYSTNNEYPNVNTLRGTSSDGTTMTTSDYTNAATTLGVSSSSLSVSKFKLVPAPCLPASFVCTGISFAPNRVYYTTRDAGANGAYNYYNGQDNNQCFGAFSDTGGAANDANSGATAYLLMYQDPVDPTKWIMRKSQKGSARSLDAGNSNNPSARCPIN